MPRKISMIIIVMLMANLFTGITAGAATATLQTPVSLTPSIGAANVPLNTKLEVRFNASQVRFNGQQSYTISDGSAVVKNVTVTANTYSINSGTVALIPPDLAFDSNKNYTVSFPEGAFVLDGGNSISSAFHWSFSTVRSSTTALTASLNPTSSSTNIALNAAPTLTFNTDVRLNSNVANGGITLRKSSNQATVSISVTASGNRVTITPYTQLEANTRYYIEIADNGIYEAQNSSNFYSGIRGTGAWTFQTATAVDRTAPLLENATMSSNTSIRLQYNEPLEYSSYISPSSFTVSVNGENRSVSSAYVSGNYVYVNLNLGVAVGQDVSISYSDRYKEIQDIAGNAASAFTSRAVTNRIDSVLPKPTEGYAYRNSVTLYFSDSLKSPSTNAYQQFTVTGDGSNKAINGISYTSSSITLKLSGSINDGEVVKVTYVPGSYPLQDYRGNNIAAFNDYVVRNTYDTKAPIFQGATGSGNKIVLTYNEQLRTTSIPLKSQFSVLVNNSPVYVNTVEVVANQVVLTLASSVAQDRSVTVSYVSGSGGIADLNGNLAGYIDLQPVTFSALVEGIRSATVKGDTITISYHSQLRYVNNLPTNQFYVAVDGATRTIQSVSLSGDTVTLKISPAVTTGQSVVVSYISGTNPLYDNLGNLLKSYNNLKLQNITNGATNSTDSRVQPTYISLSPIGEFGVGGYVLNSSVAQSSSSKSKNGHTIKKYTLDTAMLQGALNYVTNGNVTVKNLVFEVPSTEQAAEVVIPLSPLQSIHSSGKTATIAVKYNGVMYEIPIEKLKYSEIANALTVSTLSSSYLTVQLEPTSKSYMPALHSRNGVTLTLQSDPVQVNVSAYDTAYNHNVNVFHTGKLYMKATNLSTMGYSTIAQFDMQNGSTKFIPSTSTGGAGSAIFQAKITGDSMVGVVNGYSYFTDVTNHWAKAAIEELASKMIADPYSGGVFEPNKNITRAEFATFIVKGLGLEPDAANARRFTDVSTSGTLPGYIGAAAKAGIINGNTDGTFRPNSNITREQMALMMVRAMDYAEYNTNLSGSTSQYLSKFKDSGKIQNKDTVAKSVGLGIIQGMTANTFQPQGNATRAQAVVMLKRVLDKLNYL